MSAAVEVPAPGPARLSAAAARALTLRATLIALIALGIFFRFYNIDRKVYWDDEIYTSIHFIGTTEARIVAQAATFTHASDLSHVIHPGRAAIQPVGATIASLAIEDPQHPPLYYVIGHYWIEAFGDSTFTIRVLSAILGLAALPCMYWLCRELFLDTTSAWWGTALIAISPIEILYSQQAREYGLWAVMTLFMCAAFLRALRLASVWAWAIYAVSLAASLYVFPLAGFVALANLVYACSFAATTPRCRLQAAGATAIGLLSFTPWVLIVASTIRHQMSHTMSGVFGGRQSPLHILRFVATLLRLNFFDVDAVPRLHRLVKVAELIASAGVVGLVGIASLKAYRSGERRTWPYILLLIVFALAPFAFADLLISGQRTSNPRFFMPLYIGLDLALVYAIGLLSSKRATNIGRRRIWQGLLATVIICRIASSTVSASAQTWWSSYGLQAISVAHAIDASNRPLLVGDDYIVWSIALSSYLDPRTAVLVRPRCYLCSDPNTPKLNLAALEDTSGFGDLYLLGPSTELQTHVKTALKRVNAGDRYHCIDVRGTCASPLHFW